MYYALKYADPITTSTSPHSPGLQTYLPSSQLISVRNGAGAAILPQYLPQHNPPAVASSLPSSQQQPPPSPLQPTLVRVRLDFPSGNGPASTGARAFWRNHLRRLKYYNPALPITVNQKAEKGTPGNPGPAWRLFLDFEGHEKALRDLAREPENERFKEMMEEQLRPKPRNEINATEIAGKGSEIKQSTSVSSSRSYQQQQQKESSPSFPEQQSSLISTRTISLPVLNRPAGALWFWFQQRTKCTDVSESDSDKQLAHKLAEQDIKAAEDKKRGKARVDQIKAKQKMLGLAKEEASRISAE